MVYLQLFNKFLERLTQSGLHQCIVLSTECYRCVATKVSECKRTTESAPIRQWHVIIVMSLWNVVTFFFTLFFSVFQENERTQDVRVEHRFHSIIIGSGGEKIRQLRETCNNVQIIFPEQGRRSDFVQVRGPKGDVDRACSMLKKMNDDLVSLRGIGVIRHLERCLADIAVVTA